MKSNTIRLITKSTAAALVKPRQNKVLCLLVWAFGLLSLVLGYLQYRENYAQTEHFRQEVRHNWENRPDKHPHRMAHYGYVALREAQALVVFDKGLDDFLGNIIFLEAHKQNSANLSQAGGSGVLVRFGTFSTAFILQVIVPLLIFFVGFGLITAERENATLKMLNLQGASAKEILWGKILGLWAASLLLLLPFLPFTLVFSFLAKNSFSADLLLRVLGIFVVYSAFYFVFSAIAVLVSAVSKSSSQSLLKLIGIWLLMAVFLPKITQFAAQNLYPSPSRIAFETDMEKEILKTGDSHNPQDTHYKHLKDSLLVRYKVDTVTALPFNYSGFVMKESEKITSKIYTQKLAGLQDIYTRQLRVSQYSGFVNPVAALRELSVLFSGTDYFSYRDFQNQAEQYRFYLAQRLNDLIIGHLSNISPKPGEKPLSVDKKYWKETREFVYLPPNFSDALREAAIPILAMLFWVLAGISGIRFISKKIKFL